MPMENILQIITFALGFAGFIGGLLSKESGRKKSKESGRKKWSFIVLLFFLIAFSIAGSIMILKSYQRSVHLQDVSEQLLMILVNGAKTIDQLHESLYVEDFGTLSEALGGLIKTNKVGHRVVTMRDDANLRYRARLYFAR